MWTLLFATITPSFKAVHIIRADSWLGTVVTVGCLHELMQTTISHMVRQPKRCAGVCPLVCTSNFSESYVRVGQVVKTSARSPLGGCG